MFGGKGGTGGRLPPVAFNPGGTLDIAESHAIETYKSLTTTGLEAVKTALLLNGGAAVAFITFLGNLLTKHEKTSPFILPNLKPALSCYVIGLGLAGFALVVGYLLTLRIYNEAVNGWSERHRWLLWPAFGLAIGSYIAFIVGSVLASTALDRTI